MFLTSKMFKRTNSLTLEEHRHFERFSSKTLEICIYIEVSNGYAMVGILAIAFKASLLFLFAEWQCRFTVGKTQTETEIWSRQLPPFCRCSALVKILIITYTNMHTHTHTHTHTYKTLSSFACNWSRLWEQLLQ